MKGINVKIKNILQANDWGIKEFSIFFATIQLSIWGALALDLVGIDIPIIRELFGFIYLTFIPGVLILRILKLHELGNIQTFLYVVGLSLTTWMALGFFINIIYPIFGVKPFSHISLIFTVNACVFVLFVLCYFRDKNFTHPSYIDLKDLLSPSTIILFLIPFLSIFGTYLVNYYHKNILLLIMIVLIAFISLLIGFDKYFSPKLYPLVIWSMAISLIWHNSLISSYVNVCDVVGEYAQADLIIKNSYWNYTSFGSYNSVLSTVMLPPTYSIICSLDLTWVFKVIFPFLYSFVAVGAYYIFHNVTKNSKIAYFSSYFVISITPFYLQVAFIAKQTFAEIFLVLLFMLMYSNINRVKKALLIIVFSSSLIVSHYGTSYLFLFSLFFVQLYLYFINNNHVCNLIRKFDFLPEKKEFYAIILDKKVSGISLTFVLFYMVLAVSWYLYVADSSTFNHISHMFKFALDTVYNDFFDPSSSRGLYLITRESTSSLHSFSRYLYFATQFFLVVGIFKELSDKHSSRFNDTYFGFSLYFLMILFFAIANTKFSAMDPRRLFHLSLFVLAPFSVRGGLYIFQLVIRLICKNVSRITEISSVLLSVFFAMFLLFNTGFMYELSNDSPASISISQESMKRSDLEVKANFYGAYIVPQNVFSGRWLTSNIVPHETIYRGDWVEGYPSLTIYGYFTEEALNTIYTSNGTYIKSFDNSSSYIGNGYIQLSYANVIEGIGSKWYNPLQKRTVFNFSDVSPILSDKNKIYNNGGSYILCKLD